MMNANLKLYPLIGKSGGKSLRIKAVSFVEYRRPGICCPVGLTGDSMNKLRGFVPVLLLLALSVAGLLLLPDYSFSNPFQSSLYYDYPVYATGDSDGNSYVIDTSLRRVSKVSPDGNNRYVIQGGVRDGSSFFYATQIAAGEDGRLFLLDELRDEKGFYALRERVLMYGADGNPEGELLRIDYPEGHHDPSLVQRTRIIAMEPAGSSCPGFRDPRPRRT
jgi:hypothetical protein